MRTCSPNEYNEFRENLKKKTIFNSIQYIDKYKFLWSNLFFKLIQQHVHCTHNTNKRIFPTFSHRKTCSAYFVSSPIAVLFQGLHKPCSRSQLATNLTRWKQQNVQKKLKTEREREERESGRGDVNGWDEEWNIAHWQVAYYFNSKPNCSMVCVIWSDQCIRSHHIGLESINFIVYRSIMSIIMYTSFLFMAK